VETTEYLGWKKFRLKIEKQPKLEPTELRERFENLDQLYTIYQKFGDRQLVLLHQPRTLDESYYTGLECAREQDSDQVIYRYVKERAKGESTQQEGAQQQRAVGVKRPNQDPARLKTRILMVNQLWLWKIGGKQT
jgi:hypothetical protein